MKKIIILIILLSNISCAPTNKEDALKEKVSDLITAMRNNDLDKIYENLANDKELEKVYLNNKNSEYSYSSFNSFKKDLNPFKDGRINYFQKLKKSFKEGDEQWKTIKPFAILQYNNDLTSTQLPTSISDQLIKEGFVYIKTQSDNIYISKFHYAFNDNKPIIISFSHFKYVGKIDKLKEEIKNSKSDDFEHYILF